MKLPTLKELESLGFIQDITTPRQKKNGTTLYIDTDPLNRYYKIKLWINVDKKTGRITYKDISTQPHILPDEKHFIYRVINNRLFLAPKSYAGKSDRQYYFCQYPSTTKGVKKMIDDMSQEEFEARIKWTNKIYSITRLYKSTNTNDLIKEQTYMAAKLVGPFKMESN